MNTIQKYTFLFVDMNAYFASVEQQCQPELRGRPVAVAPVMVDSTCCIAASYEAKRFGIQTGTKVAAARRLCPKLKVVEARPEVYVRHHEKIVKAVESVVPIDQVHSIDEMSCRLTGYQQTPENAIALGRAVKNAIYQQVGSVLRCSVGLATNRTLAKIASDYEKPDGLTTIGINDLPEMLFTLDLEDLPGIGRRMKQQLMRWGIRTVEDLYQQSESEMHEIWNSVVGRRWWYLLRGHDLPEKPTRRRSVGHSHVLPPQFRSEQGAAKVLSKLLHKAATRLRLLGYYTSRLTVQLKFLHQQPGWKASSRVELCQDTQTLLKVFGRLWEQRPRGQTPLKVFVSLTNLEKASNVTPSLFPEDQKRLTVAEVIDEINARQGPHTLHFANMHGTDKAAPMRIAFTKIPDLKTEFERNNP